MALAYGHRAFSHLDTVDANDFQAVCARLETIFLDATPQQVIDGMGWYAARERHMQTLAALSGLDVRIVAAAASALSANTRWDRNEAAIDAHIRAYAYGLTETPRTQGWGTLYHCNDVKAWAILHAPDAETAFVLLGQGLKTQSFAPAMLLRPEWLRGVVEEAVIDSVAYQAATGTVPTGGINKTEYRALVRAYVWLARKYNVSVDQAQAIVWVVWRGSAV